jgi:hypothetical protein
VQKVLLEGLGLFFGCMVLHVVVWRLYPVQSQGIGLVMIFGVMPIFFFAARFSATMSTAFEVQDTDWSIWLLAYLLHLSFSGSYFFLYTVSLSPSVAMLQRVAHSMPTGLKRSELAPEWFTDENFSGVRLSNLLEGGLITESDGILKLNPKGLKVARGFLIFRRFLGLSDIGQG